MRKKFLSVLLALCMVLTMVPATAMAADWTVAIVTAEATGWYDLNLGEIVEGNEVSAAFDISVTGHEGDQGLKAGLKITKDGEIKFESTETDKVICEKQADGGHIAKEVPFILENPAAGEYEVTATVTVLNSDGTESTESKEATTTIYVIPKEPEGITAKWEDTAGENGGKLVGTTTAMEYKLVEDERFKDCAANETTGLAEGNYYVRYKETTTAKASAVFKIYVGPSLNKGQLVIMPKNDVDDNGGWYDYNQVVKGTNKVEFYISGYNFPDEKTAINLKAEITKEFGDNGVVFTKNHSFNITDRQFDSQQVGYNLSSLETGEYLLTLMEDDESVVNGAEKAIYTIKIIPAAPTGFEVVKPTGMNSQDARILGTTTDMEWSLNPHFETQNDCTGTSIDNLVAGTYYIRYKAVSENNIEASAAAIVEIPMIVGENELDVTDEFVVFQDNGGVELIGMMGLRGGVPPYELSWDRYKPDWINFEVNEEEYTPEGSTKAYRIDVTGVRPMEPQEACEFKLTVSDSKGLSKIVSIKVEPVLEPIPEAKHLKLNPDKLTIKAEIDKEFSEEITIVDGVAPYEIKIDGDQTTDGTDGVPSWLKVELVGNKIRLSGTPDKAAPETYFGISVYDSSAEIVDGYVGVIIEPIVKKLDNEVIAEKPDVKLDDGVEDNDTAKDIKRELEKESGKDIVQGTELKDAANGMSETIERDIPGDTELETIKKDNNNINSFKGDNVSLTAVVQTYIDIEITAADTGSITYNITPMYRVVATSAKVEESEEIKVFDGKNEASANAVIVEEGKKLDVTKTVDVKIPVPAGFGNTAWVKHEAASGTYFYKGTVAGNWLTFTNPHGFSKVTATNSNGSVASKVENGSYVGYESIQTAVNEATASDEIKLEQNITENVEVNVPATKTSFKINANGHTGIEKIEMKAPAGCVVIKSAKGDKLTYTVRLTAPTFKVNGKNVSGEATSRGTARVQLSAADGATIMYSVDNEAFKVYTGAFEVTEGTAVIKARALKGQLTSGISELTLTIEEAGSHGGGGSHSLDEIKGGKYDNLPKEDEKPVIGDDSNVDPSNPFVDVATSDPYYDAIVEVYKRGWMVGISDNTFASAGTLTRGMAAQILWNKAGNPAPTNVSPFLDVTSDKWYATAIAWAYEQGLVLGYDGTTFGPDDFVTTEQFTIMLDKAAGNTPAPYVGGAANATRGWVANEIVK